MIIRILVLISFFFVIQVFAEKIDRSDIKLSAVNWLNYKSSNKANHSKKIAKINSFEVNGLETIFVVEFKRSGFVILSSDDKIRPILGYSLTNNFDFNNMSPGIKNWIDSYSSDIFDMIDKTNITDGSNKKLWNELINNRIETISNKTVIVDPLIQTTWKQGYPYNIYCPVSNGQNCVVGCVATAMVQIMRYYQHPLHGVGTYEGINFSDQVYNWQIMPNSASTGNSYEQHETALISYHCGVSVNMNYGVGGSSAYSSDVREALVNHFKYNENAVYKMKYEYSQDEWLSFIDEDLENNRPILYDGATPDVNIAHAFILDGSDGDSYYHFNLGWGGVGDGYYYLDNINPLNYSFGDNNGAVFHIFPIEEELPDVIENLTIEFIDGQGNISWDPYNNPEELDHYNIYRNDSLLAQTNELEYIDTEVSNLPYYAYFVTAETNTSESLPSNTVYIDFSSPEFYKASGFATQLNQDMELFVEIIDFTALEYVRAEYTILGITESVDMEIVESESGLMVYSCNLPSKDSETLGTVKFIFEDINGYANESDEFQIIWAESTLITEDFETGDFSNNNWEFCYDVNWLSTNDISYSGEYSVKSGNVQYQTPSSGLKIDVVYPVDGTVSFAKKVSSYEYNNYLSFYIDGKKQNQWSGENDWSVETFEIPRGFHEFKWRYRKREAPAGDDCGYIDDIIFDGIKIGSVDIEEDYELIISDNELKQNYPNPFNPVTKINYTSASLSVNQSAEIVIHNAMGQSVWVSNPLSLSTNHCIFDGSKFNSGIYYYSLVIDNKVIQTKSMVLIK